MAYFLNNILLAKNDDGEPWMQMLVYIVFAVLWVLGIISKKVLKKQQEKQQKEKGAEPKDTTMFKNKENIREYKHPVSQSKKIHQPAHRAISKFQQTSTLSKITHIKKLHSKIKKLETPTTTAIKRIPTKPIYTQHQKTETSNFAQEVIADLTTDTDSLKKAILYHEILGKPVSLRDTI